MVGVGPGVTGQSFGGFTGVPHARREEDLLLLKEQDRRPLEEEDDLRLEDQNVLALSEEEEKMILRCQGKIVFFVVVFREKMIFL